jgi:hypothetical protein
MAVKRDAVGLLANHDHNTANKQRQGTRLARTRSTTVHHRHEHRYHGNGGSQNLING